MIDKIRELEKAALQLEPAASQRAIIREKVVAYSEKFLEELASAKAYEAGGDKGEGLLLSPFSEAPSEADELLKIIAGSVDSTGINPASAGHLGYIPGGGLYYSALGDYLADISNRYAGVYFASPGAVKMENMIINWTAGLMGYPAEAAGNLTSGGSMANLIAIVTARDAAGFKARDTERFVVYMTRQVHHSVNKALRIAGLKECMVRHIPMDEQYRMDTAELEKTILADKKEGLNPFLVIASAGTTDTGAVDPLDDIATLAAMHGAWLHTDAAYGGYFILTEEGKKTLKGIGRSDSFVADPHKTLFMPYGTGIVVVKDKNLLRRPHEYMPSYLQDTAVASEELSPADLSPELTKHFRGLRLWLPLKLHGVGPFRAALEEKLLLARYFHHEIKKAGFETGPEPQLSVVTYRYVPGKGDADLFNEKLVKEIQEDGRVFISSTRINGKFMLRLAIVAFRTHLDTINLAIEILKEKANKILRSE